MTESLSPSSFKDAAGAVRKRMAAACRKAGRDPQSVALMAVSKTATAETILEALAAGQRLFGENRLEEAQGKYGPLKALYPDLRLHFIGRLQSRKIRPILETFDTVESLESLSHAAKIARLLPGIGRQISFLAEINGTDDPHRGGVSFQQAPQLIGAAQDLGLRITGVMGIAPLGQPPEAFFEALAALAQRLALGTVSAGMSEDMEAAIAAGSTQIRIGGALFGPRTPQGARPS